MNCCRCSGWGRGLVSRVAPGLRARLAPGLRMRCPVCRAPGSVRLSGRGSVRPGSITRRFDALMPGFGGFVLPGRTRKAPASKPQPGWGPDAGKAPIPPMPGLRVGSGNRRSLVLNPCNSSGNVGCRRLRVRSGRNCLPGRIHVSLGYGVIGNTLVSGTNILGSSPGTPALHFRSGTVGNGMRHSIGVGNRLCVILV